MLSRVLRVLAAIVLALVAAAGCGGAGDDGAGGSGDSLGAASMTPPPPAGAPTVATESTSAAPLPGLPAWTAGYDDWTRLNAEPIPPRESDPHLSTKNVFASAEIAGALYPAGTVVVKAGVRPGTDFVGLVATMRKMPGADPAHNDWVFVEWAREAPDRPFTVLAQGDVCASCHAGVADRDYVFTERDG